MRISGPPVPPLPTPTAPGRARGSAGAPGAEFPSPAEAGPPVEAGTPSGEKPHGLVGAAEHSHRSDVAALRQWINHPDLRGDLAVPDLAAEHKGNGFQKAVAAYQAAAAPAPAPPADSTPVVTDPAPVVTDPGPVITDPAPVVVTDQPSV